MSHQTISSVNSDELAVDREIDEFQEINYNYDEYPSDIFIYNGVEYQRGKYVGKGTFSFCFDYRSRKGDKVALAKISSMIDMKNRHDEYKNISWIREVDIFQNLNHENIVKFYTTKETKSLRYIFMELLICNLSQEHIRNPKMTVRTVREYMRDIFSGLKYLHDQKIVHRDIKMSNLLLNSENRIKICDFGLSVRLEDDTMTFTRSSACGTKNYLSPETINQSYALRTATDIWSAGVVMCALLVGKLPFAASSFTFTCVRIRNCLYDFPRAVELQPGGFFAKKILKYILTVDSFKRPSATCLLREDFFRDDWLAESMNQIPDKSIYVSSDNSNSMMRQLKLLLQINRLHKSNKYEKYEIHGSFGSKLWLVGYLEYAKHLGLPYVLSDGTIGMLFMNQISIILTTKENKLNTFVQTSDDNHLREIQPGQIEYRNKRKILYALQSELSRKYADSPHLPTDVKDVPSIITSFYLYSKLLIVTFSNQNIQINIECPDTNIAIEFLIDQNHVHIFNNSEYISFKRNYVPSRFLKIIEHAIQIMNQN